MLTITPLQQAGAVLLPPDIVWNGYAGDLALDPATGLRAANPLVTAAVMLLFTDAKARPEQLRWEHGGDRRGWAGNTFDVDIAHGEDELGSLLWLYRRSELTDETARAIQAEARRALDPLIRQEVVARIETEAVADKPAGRVILSIDLIGKDGRSLYATKFDLLWRAL